MIDVIEIEINIHNNYIWLFWLIEVKQSSEAIEWRHSESKKGFLSLSRRNLTPLNNNSNIIFCDVVDVSTDYACVIIMSCFVQ